jgi:HSP20 family molecular chaperone IbpA
VPAEAVSVELSGRDLTLSARTDDLTWQRTVRLGASLDAEQVSARHVDGRLTVTVAAVAPPEPRRIAVDTAPAQPAIEVGESPAPEGDAG